MVLKFRPLWCEIRQCLWPPFCLSHTLKTHTHAHTGVYVFCSGFHISHTFTPADAGLGLPKYTSAYAFHTIQRQRCPFRNLDLSQRLWQESVPAAGRNTTQWVQKRIQTANISVSCMLLGEMTLNSALNVLIGLFRAGCVRLAGLFQRTSPWMFLWNPVYFLSTNPGVKLDLFRLGGDYWGGVSWSWRSVVGGSTWPSAKMILQKSDLSTNRKKLTLHLKHMGIQKSQQEWKYSRREAIALWVLLLFHPESCAEGLIRHIGH